MGRGRLTITLSLFGVLFFYQNCDHSENLQPVSDPMVVKIGGEERALLDLSSVDHSVICHSSQYVCVERVYRPGLAFGSNENESCIELQTASGTRSVCALVKRFTYDSSGALAACEDCSAADGEPGGEFNYSDMKCYHPDVVSLHRRDFPLVADGVDLVDVLARAVANCEKAGTQ